jgi:pyrrolidone-carboxylate peptidase
VSNDAGRYLCEFIYFRSMEESVKSGIPVLFCHVPFEGQPFSMKEMTEVILRLVGVMVDMTEMDATRNKGINN